MTRWMIATLCLAATSFQVAKGSDSIVDNTDRESWKQVLSARLPYYGHRNWIVIADSAYPAQSRDGIETVVSDASQEEVLRYVLAAVSSSKHVRPDIFTDRELRHVPESGAPGIESYRNGLGNLFQGATVRSLPHEQIIAKLDEAAKTFRILIIKTNMTMPYTSVFLQLNCAYWSDENEKSLRATMSRQEK